MGRLHYTIPCINFMHSRMLFLWIVCYSYVLGRLNVAVPWSRLTQFDKNIRHKNPNKESKIKKTIKFYKFVMVTFNFFTKVFFVNFFFRSLTKKFNTFKSCLKNNCFRIKLLLNISLWCSIFTFFLNYNFTNYIYVSDLWV